MRSWRSKLFSALFVCLLCPFICAAQQRISGTITDKRTHAPVKAAAVRLESDVLPDALTTTTDADGRFSFASLSPSRYDVRVSADNFYPQQISLTLAPRATEELDFELTPQANINEQVTVRAQAKLLDETQAATIRTIDVRELDALPAARHTQLTDAITPFVSSAVAGHDNLVHLRGNELSLNTL